MTANHQPSKFRRVSGVMLQADARLVQYRSIREALTELDEGTLDGIEIAAILGRRNERFTLNLTSALIWELLEQPSALTDLVAILSGIYAGVPSETMCRDITSLFDELIKLDLVDVL